MKKPKLKLINSAQKGNAAETPKSAAKEKKEKAKPKTKKAAAVPTPPKEPELSAEEKSKKKEVGTIIKCETDYHTNHLSRKKFAFCATNSRRVSLTTPRSQRKKR